MKETVAILFGGESSEYEVSCASAANVIENTDRSRYDVIKVGITKDGKWWIFRGTPDDIRSCTWDKKPELLVPAILSPCKAHHGFITFDKEKSTYGTVPVDVIFPVLHGKNGEDGTMQGLLTLSGVPYVGCDTCSSAVSMDKTIAKTIAERENIPTVPFVSALRSSKTDLNALICECEEKFGYPVFIKPANAGSSVGITKAKSRSEFLKGAETAFSHDRKLLVEPAVTGREIEVAVIGNKKLFASDCGEIIPHSDFYDYDTKYNNDSAECITDPKLDSEMNEKIGTLALKIYAALGCSGLSRVDFFLTENGPLFNEINTIPGFTQISMYPKLMEKAGIPYKKLITALLTLAKG